ncbi:MAG: S8 family serine peptidase [Thermoanaerobaculum sp.]|nr:S8 family serine peptidase [Thermoanaerobaculum sp.]
MGVHALAQVQAQLQAVEAQQEAFVAQLRQRGAEFVELYRLQKLANGVALELPPAAISWVKGLPGVVRVRPLVPKSPLLGTAVPLVRAPQAWQYHGATGRGVRVGIIDTGIDYLHRAFGGPGTGYSANDTTKLGDAPYPNAKVVGGWDFAGDDYDAGSDTPSRRTPKPDPDPMDCGGHGTHVASIAAGFGVTGNGQTFPGPFNTATPFADLRIAPGAAPEAQLYALRVFGCSGTTALVARALEWAADPNGDNNPADRLDIVNLSLGSPWGEDDSPDSLAANNASRLGVLVVASAGNSGDTAFITGSPAAATAALSVAASVDAGAVVGAFEVLAPSALAGTYPAAEAAFGPNLANIGDREGFLASPQAGEELGCNPFSASSGAALSGKIALINRGVCSFKRKVLNAQNVGAIGVLIVRQDNGDPFTMGDDPSITDTINIPSQMTVLSVGEQLRARLTAGVRVRLTARFRNQFLYSNPEREDTVASFSSRGPRGDLLLKPDLSAPGESVFAASHGTGDRGVSLNGTSMAAPLVAGVAALVKQLRPELTPRQLKALLMNTALDDLFGTTKGQPPRHQVSRAGAGRVDAERALGATLLMYARHNPEAVSLSLGLLPAPGSATAAVTMRNLGGARTVALAFTPTQPVPGLVVTPQPASLALGPGEEATVTLLLSLPLLTAPPRDATQATQQGNWPRFFLWELSGHLVAREGEQVVARVPVYGVLVPAQVAVGTPAILAAGGGNLALANTAGSWVAALELAYLGERKPGVRPANVLFGGVATTSGSTNEPLLTFGVVTQDPWISPEQVRIRVDFDLDRNGTADVRLQNQRASDNTDAFVTAVCRPVSGPCTATMPLGGVSPEGPHPPVFATTVMVLTAPASALGWTGGAFDFWFSTVDEVGQATASPRVTYNPASPNLRITGPGAGPAVWRLLPSQTLQVQAGETATRLLLLFPENREGFRAQVVPVQAAQKVRRLVRAQRSQ